MAFVIYTDLDGTLLDHESYQYDLAIPALRLLKQQKFPVVPVTSKTRAEVIPLLNELELDSPLVVENGAAVFLPEAFGSDIKELTAKMDGYFVKAFAPDMEFWQMITDVLHELLPNTFSTFSEMSALEITELTGLSIDEAERAGQREFSDPLHWFGSDQQLNRLTDYCKQKDINVVRGGRFVHLLKGSDKGKAVQWLHKIMQQQFKEPMTSIGLGDGENDLALLDAVDLPVQIRSPTHDFPKYEHEKLYRTKAFGPAGWAEAVFTLLKKH